MPECEASGGAFFELLRDPKWAAQSFTALTGGGDAKCPHGRVRGLERCVECWESFMKQSKACSESAKKFLAPHRHRLPCEHCSERRHCRICKGYWVCRHGIHKVYCKECDGRRLCQVCFRRTLPRCYEVCWKCRSLEESLRSVARKKFKPPI